MIQQNSDIIYTKIMFFLIEVNIDIYAAEPENMVDNTKPT